MEGRHDLPNLNIVSGLPQFSLFFFEQIYSSLNTKIPPTTSSVSSPDPPNNSSSFWGIPEMLCFFSSFSSEHKEVSVVTLRITLPSFSPLPALHSGSQQTLSRVPRLLQAHGRRAWTSLCADRLWRPQPMLWDGSCCNPLQEAAAPAKVRTEQEVDLGLPG